MDGILTSWRIVLGDPAANGIVLLDWPDFTVGEPRIAPKSKLDIVSYLRSPGAGIFPRGNATFEVSFTRIVVCVSDADARAFKLQHLAAIAPFLGPSAALDCSIFTDPNNPASTAVLGCAAIQPGSPEIVTESYFCFCKYVLIGNSINVAGINGGVLGTEQGAPLETEGGAQIAL